MSKKETPSHYSSLKDRFPAALSSLEELGKAVRAAGPLDEKTIQLIQLAAAASIQSEGSVHSHARRALEAGATPEELYHSIISLISTIGFPRAAAAVSWVDDIVRK